MSSEPRKRDLSKTVGSATLESAIAEFLTLRELDTEPAIESFISRHPHLGRELREFFEDQDAFAKLAQPILEFQSAFSLTDMDLVGQRIGDYELLEEIGRGGMGKIYRATQISLQRDVAIKVIHSVSPEDLPRFKQEAESAARLDHPGIIPIYETGEDKGVHFIVMKLIGSGTLEQQIDSGKLPQRLGLAVVIQVAEAIQFAHQNSILHRDLKPSNILVEESQKLSSSEKSKSTVKEASSGIHPSTDIKAYVTDFGLAKQLQIDTELTITGTILGSPKFHVARAGQR